MENRASEKMQSGSQTGSLGMNAGREPISEELDVLKTVTRRLADAGIPYMVTGSIAMNFYAMPRMTRDIDIVVELEVTDVDRIVDLFHEEFYLEREAVRQAVTTLSMCNLIHTASLIKVDFIVRKNTEYRHKEFSRRRQVRIGEQDLFFVTPEDLILSKLDWARESRSEVQLKDVRKMNDTSPEMEQRFREMLMARSGEERLTMGCSMHATAKALVRAGILQNNPDATPEQIRQELFLRFYGQDFDATTQEKILRRLAQLR